MTELQKQAANLSLRLFKALTQAGKQDMVIDADCVSELVKLLDTIAKQKINNDSIELELIRI